MLLKPALRQLDRVDLLSVQLKLLQGKSIVFYHLAVRILQADVKRPNLKLFRHLQDHLEKCLIRRQFLLKNFENIIAVSAVVIDF